MSGYLGYAAPGPAAPPIKPRFGQLTYSSFDRRDGRGGGWQVKDTSGDLDPGEIEALRSRVQTQFDAGTELPKFPTQAQIDELPRKFSCTPLAGAAPATVSWHVAPAGADASGRPGNVFAHLVLDRRPDGTDQIRPIQRWRSPDWLTPYGPDQVLAARLGTSEAPRPGPVSALTVSNWLFAPRKFRMGTLALLLDAVTAAMHGGPRVVLGTEEVDDAANWIAAISLAMSRGTAREFYFSTLERPNTLAEAFGRGIHLACVPRGDLPALARLDRVAVLDAEARPALGDFGGEPHTTGRGDRIVVTEWSLMIGELFLDPTTTQESVEEIDRVAHSVGDIGLDPAWPAAMLIARRADTDLREEAQRVLAAHTPKEAAHVTGVVDSLSDSVRAEAGGDTDRAWSLVTRYGADTGRGPEVIGRVAAGVYAELALADRAWLARSGAGRLPAPRSFPEEPDPALVAAARTGLAEVALDEAAPVPEQVAQGRTAVHLLELALRARLGIVLQAELMQLIEAVVLPMLLRPHLVDPLIADLEGRIGSEARAWLWGALGYAPLAEIAPPGERVRPRVLDWLGPRAGEPDPIAHASPRADGSIDLLVAELAWHRLRSGVPPQDSAKTRFVAIWSGLEHLTQHPDRALADRVAALFDPALPAEFLTVADRRFRTAIPTGWYLSQVLTGDPTPAAQQWWGTLGQRSQDGPIDVPTLARFRLETLRPDWFAGLSPAALGSRLDSVTRAFERPRPEPHPTLARHLKLLCALILLGGQQVDPRLLDQLSPEAPPIKVSRGLRAPEHDPTVSGETFDALVAWGNQYLQVPALAAYLLHGDPQSPLYQPRDRVAVWLWSLRTDAEDHPTLLGELLVERINRSAESRDATADELFAALRRVEGTADERAARNAERYLNNWMRIPPHRRIR
ncbi:hypothetical protein [Granulicoccus phenolivorans]|uniref:GAP1-N2 domain-containing protein n=1 Tax=Granulicoccus phenolivorans TaxID=266854 RepID=UPI0004276EFB|nr:hypothetical protein [Granulicoccus phenolivorans]